MTTSQVRDGIYCSTSYGSINNSFSQWNCPDIATHNCDDAYSEQQTRVCQLEEDNFDYEDNFLYHTVSSRGAGVPTATGVGQEKGSATPYYSSATDQRSDQEHSDAEIHFKTQIDRKASSALITWNLLNLLLGNGILALPFAVYKAGVIVFGIIALVSIITMYTGKILIDCLHETRYLPNGNIFRVRVRKDYVELGQDAFDSAVGGVVVHVLQCCEMISICILNLIVLGELCHEVFPFLDVKMCTLIGALFSFPSVLIRKIQWVAWMQLVGTLSLGLALLLIQAYCLANASEWKPTLIPMYDLDNISIAFGIVIYSFSIHPVLPGIEEHMRHPGRYNSVLYLTFVAVCIIQYLFGFTNASLYGKSTKQLITIDLQHHYNLGVTSAIIVFVSVIFCLALPTYVVMERVDKGFTTLLPSFAMGSRRHFLLAIVVRLFIIGLALAIAVLVPYFAYVMAFIGCSIKILLSIILPCLFHLMVKANSLAWYLYVTDILIIFFGIFSMAVGMYQATARVI